VSLLALRVRNRNAGLVQRLVSPEQYTTNAIDLQIGFEIGTPIWVLDRLPNSPIYSKVYLGIDFGIDILFPSKLEIEFGIE
jgi:hypothetical protein